MIVSTRKAICVCGIAALLAGIAAVSASCGGGNSAASTPTPAKVAATATTPAKTAAAATKPPDPTAGPAPTESEKEQNVAVSLTEWKITAPGGGPIGPLKAGEIKFDAHNDGTTQHEFVVIRTDADPASLAVEDGKVNEDTAGESPGEADDIDAGQAKVATMRLEPGKYVFICNVVGHYQSGMHGQLIVQ